MEKEEFRSYYTDPKYVTTQRWQITYKHKINNAKRNGLPTNTVKRYKKVPSKGSNEILTSLRQFNRMITSFTEAAREHGTFIWRERPLEGEHILVEYALSFDPNHIYVHDVYMIEEGQAPMLKLAGDFDLHFEQPNPDYIWAFNTLHQNQKDFFWDDVWNGS